MSTSVSQGTLCISRSLLLHGVQKIKIRNHIISRATKCTLISGFPRDVDEICALLGYYAASGGNCLPTFRYNVSVPSSRVKSPSWLFFPLGLLIREDGTDTLSRNVGKQLPHDAAQYPRRAQISKYTILFPNTYFILQYLVGQFQSLVLSPSRIHIKVIFHKTYVAIHIHIKKIHKNIKNQSKHELTTRYCNIKHTETKQCILLSEYCDLIIDSARCEQYTVHGVNSIQCTV
jgi:hypothetical protein